jgi:hypothetical protein
VVAELVVAQGALNQLHLADEAALVRIFVRLFPKVNLEVVQAAVDKYFQQAGLFVRHH